MSTELDLCCVEATGLIREAIEHILSRDSCEKKLREELLQWQGDGGGEREKPQEVAEYCRNDSAIPFELVLKIHQQLKADPLG